MVGFSQPPEGISLSEGFEHLDPLTLLETGCLNHLLLVWQQPIYFPMSADVSLRQASTKNHHCWEV